MSSITLAESAYLSQDMLLKGVIESTITVDRFYEVLGFMPIQGNALAYNREATLGDIQGLAVGGTITAKNAATVTQASTSLVTLIGDAEVNNLIASTRSNINDQTGYQISSKVKTLSRTFQNYLINGVSSTTQFDGLLSLVDAGKTIAADATDGDVLSFAVLDELLDNVTDKDGQVDYLIMHSRTLRAYMSLLRALGGASINEVVTLPSGVQVPAYRGVPIFRNDWVPVNQTQGASSAATSIIAGTLDDGSNTVGISGLSGAGAAGNDAGMMIEDVGIHQSRDEHIYRIKWYTALALFNLNGLAVATGIVEA